MKIYAKLKDGRLDWWPVTYIEFTKEGNLKWVKGIINFARKQNYPIGAHIDEIDLDKRLEIKFVRE